MQRGKPRELKGQISPEFEVARFSWCSHDVGMGRPTEAVGNCGPREMIEAASAVQNPAYRPVLFFLWKQN